MADIAAAHLITSFEADRQRVSARQLQAALDSRVVIEQAKGMVAAQRGVSVQESFEILRRHARDRNATLRTVAEAVVARRFRP